MSMLVHRHRGDVNKDLVTKVADVTPTAKATPKPKTEAPKKKATKKSK